MNRQQLLEMIRVASREAVQLNGRAPAPPLTLTMRETQASLSELKNAVAEPDLPLPSAESIASFIAGTCEAREEQQIVQACVHDVGILFQIVNAVQAEHDQPAEVSQSLRTRLLELKGQTDQRSNAVLESNPAQSTGPLPLPAPVTTELAPATTESAESQSSTQGHRRVSWQLWGLVAAALIIAIGGFAISSLRNDNAQPQLTGNELPEVRHQEEEDLLLTQDDDAEQAEGPATGPPPDGIDDALDRLESMLVGPASNDDSATSAAGNSDAAVVPSNRPKPENTATASNTAQPPNRNDHLRSQVPPVQWDQITGILARQTEESYDRWAIVRLEADDEQVANSWLTLPSCWARGNLANGGALVMGENTSLQATAPSPDRVSVNLRFGSVAMVDLPAGQRIVLSGMPKSVQELQIDQPASLLIKRIVGGAQITLNSGSVTYGSEKLPSQRTLVIKGDQVTLGSETVSAPEWIAKLPKQSALSRQILSNLDSSGDLGTAMDKQLGAMLRNVNQNNATSVNNLRKLCLWRARLAVEDESETAQHKYWMVRGAAFDSVLFSVDHLPSQMGRRRLVARLTGTPPQTIRNWIECAKGNRKPTRQDIAQWLNFLTSDDPVVAAFADYLLRKRFGGGPEFDPQATAKARAIAQRLWRNTVARTSDR